MSECNDCPNHLLDLVPKGRDEGGRGPYWVRRHDEYSTDLSPR